jgi:hypothetical protein
MTTIENVFVSLDYQDNDDDQNQRQSLATTSEDEQDGYEEDESEEETPKNKDLVLTRYLYIYDEVLTSLAAAIIEKDRDQAMFWTYELYYSGYQVEVAEYLLAVYNEFMRAYNPKFAKFIESMVERQAEGPHIVGSMVRNMVDTSRFAKPVQDFLKPSSKPLPPQYKETKFTVLLNEKDVEKYKTIETTENVPARKILPKVCLYATRKDLNQLFNCRHKDLEPKEVVELMRYNWPYYAAKTPVWKQRIQDHNGIIDEEDECIFWDPDLDIEKEEAFYLLYGYDLDEQSLAVQSKIMPLELIH